MGIDSTNVGIVLPESPGDITVVELRAERCLRLAHQR